MYRYVICRTLLLVPTILAVYTITFALIHLTPGGPWDREKPVPAEIQAHLNKKYGLDQPIWEQYFRYIWDVVRYFDFGPSYKSTSRTVNDVIRDHFPISIQLGLLAMAIGTIVGVTLGVVSALRQNSWIDYASMFFAILGVSVPSFVVGPVFVLVFSLWLNKLTAGQFWLPSGSWGRPEHFVLPAATLALYPAALLARYTRSSMLEVIHADYIRTARAKGLMERAVIIRHALKNALIPVVTVAGWLVAIILTGSFYVETVFSVPGLGRYFVTSVSNRDYPVLMGVTLLFAGVVAVMNLLVDLLYAYIDPRITYK